MAPSTFVSTNPVPASARAVVRFAAALGSVVLLAGWPQAAALADAGCGPAVRVSGDARLAAEVGAALGRRGVGSEGTDACPALAASLRREEGLIVVSRGDPTGREARRKVVHVEEAASVIESWVRADLGDELMAGWSVDAAAMEVPAAPPAEAKEEPRRDPASIVVTGDLAVDGADSLWLGTSIDTCVRLGPVCAGGAGRFRRGGDGGRTEVAALAIVDLPLRLGPVVVAPGIALGAAGLSRYDDSGGGDDDGIGGWRPRGEGRLRLSIPLAGPLSFDANAAAELSPAGSTARKEDDDDSAKGATDPTFFFRVGAGLRVGLP